MSRALDPEAVAHEAALPVEAGPFNPRIPRGWAIGWADADWCLRIRDVGGEIVYYPEATVVHSYRRATSRKPISGAALRQLRYFFDFQWKYRHRRRELIALADELDRRAAGTSYQPQPR